MYALLQFRRNLSSQKRAIYGKQNDCHCLRGRKQGDEAESRYGTFSFCQQVMQQCKKALLHCFNKEQLSVAYSNKAVRANGLINSIAYYGLDLDTIKSDLYLHPYSR